MKITMNTLEGVTLKTKNKYVNEDIAVSIDQAVVDEIYQDGFQEGVASVPPNKLPSMIDESLTEITEKDLAGATSIRKYAFAYAPITSIEIPNGVTSIGDYAFHTCTSLREVTIPNSVTSIGSYTFYNCTSLKSIVMPNSIKYINSSLFSTCTSLTSIIIPASVTTISSSAFYDCKSLTNLTIPASVTKIDSYSLKIGTSENKATITFESTTPPNISSNTFNASYLDKIIVPKGCGDAYKAKTNWSNFAEYIVESET